MRGKKLYIIIAILICILSVALAEDDKPVKSVKAKEQSITIKCGETYSPEITISPEDATNQALTWASSDESICTVADGNIQAIAAGNCEITFTTTDGSDKSGKIKVAVPVFDEKSYDYTVTDKDGILIPIDLKGVSVQNIQHKASSDSVFYYYIDSYGLRIYPIQSGKASVSLTNKLNKNDKTVFNIIVDENAVYAKNEPSPLRVIVVADESVVTGKEVKGKYIVLGGSGKYESVKITGDIMNRGVKYQMGESDIITKHKKDRGTFSVKIKEGTPEDMYYRFYVEACDSDGKTTSAGSQAICISNKSDVEAIADTAYVLTSRKNGFHFKYYIRGGTEPYTGTYRDSMSNTKPIKLGTLGNENSFDYDYPELKPYENDDPYRYVVIDITDKKKEKTTVSCFNINSTGQHIAVKCDRQFARVGDVVNCKLIAEDANGNSLSYFGFVTTTSFKICYADYDTGYNGLEQEFQPVLTDVATINKTENEWLFTCDRPGRIYFFYEEYGEPRAHCITIVD